MGYQTLFVVLALVSCAAIPAVRCDTLHRVTTFESPSGSGSSASSATSTNSVHSFDAQLPGDAAAAEASASSFSTPTAPVNPVGPPPVVGPPIHPPLPLGGAGAGIGFHKNIDFSAGKGIGILPFLQGIIPGLGAGGIPPPVPPPVAGGIPPPVAAGPVDPGLLGGLGGLGGLLGNGGGYLGLPGFLGPSYIPQTWIGSALGAKGDLWFPVVIFIFAIAGVWAVAHFLLSLIVPLIASKLVLEKGIIAKKLRSVDEENSPEHHQNMVDDLTQKVMAAIDKNYGDRDHKPLAKNQPWKQHQHDSAAEPSSPNGTVNLSPNSSDTHKHPVLSAFNKK